jgi:hypothetical protein
MRPKSFSASKTNGADGLTLVEAAAVMSIWLATVKRY